MSRSRCRWPGALLLGALLFVVGCPRKEPPTRPLGEADKVEVARMLVAWAVHGAHPDVDTSADLHGGPPPPSRPEYKRVLLLCTFVPPGQELTTDARVNRVTWEQWQGADKPPLDTAKLYLTLNSEGPDLWRVSVQVYIRAEDGKGHWGLGRWQWGRLFEVRRTAQGLKAKFKGVITE